MKTLEVIEEIERLKKYVEILGTPDEFFKHMNGHTTELSLVLSAFDLANESETILLALENQMEYSLKSQDGDTGICKCGVITEIIDAPFYCKYCGQRLKWNKDGTIETNFDKCRKSLENMAHMIDIMKCGWTKEQIIEWLNKAEN